MMVTDDARRATTRSRKSDWIGLQSLRPLYQLVQWVNVGPLPVDDLVLAEDFLAAPVDFFVFLLELLLCSLLGLLYLWERCRSDPLGQVCRTQFVGNLEELWNQNKNVKVTSEIMESVQIKGVVARSKKIQQLELTSLNAYYDLILIWSTLNQNRMFSL